jgi:pyrroline-5-carboxylate reductase
MAFIGLVGCGNLGSSMLSRWLKNGADPSLIKVVDNHPERIEGFNMKPSRLSDLSGVDVLIVSVKPWDVSHVLHQIKPDSDAIVLSTAAGVSLRKLSQMVPDGQPVARVIPNLGVRIGLGVLAVAFNHNCTSSHKESIKEILEPLGHAIEMREQDFNAVTALAGSGPAYVSLMLESLIMGGIAGGLSRDTAQSLAQQTVSGTLELVKAGLSFEEIRFLVCSPAGTTVAGLEVLERDGVRGSIIEAIREASSRAMQLGLESEPEA